MSKRLNSDPNLNFRIQRSCSHSCFFSLSKEGPMETIPWLDRLIFSTNIRVIFPSLIYHIRICDLSFLYKTLPPAAR